MTDQQQIVEEIQKLFFATGDQDQDQFIRPNIDLSEINNKMFNK